MKRTCMATAIITGVAGLASHASAVNLNQNGLGQVLIYPYYTVNAGQQTLLSVVNTTNVGKAVKVHFLEGYNGRDVLDFNLFLSRYDVWTAVVFKLSDAGIAGDGAGIFTTDKSCMAPNLTQGPLSNGAGYQKFLNYAYTGADTDTGPTSDARTKEGHLEMITMADIVPASTLDRDISHVNGVPPGCFPVEVDFEANSATVAPTSGLFGSVSIVDVAEGTFYAYTADALEGFTYVPLNSSTGVLQPTLASVNDRASPLTATSRVLADGESLTSVFPASQAIDAVSSVFAAENVYNEYVSTQDGTIGTDWVLTFPTKRFYVDSQFVSTASPPFEHQFGASDSGNGPGFSCVNVGVSIFDREENVTDNNTACGFPECPPPLPSSLLCLETNVIRFAATSVLGSELPTQRLKSLGQGFVRLSLAGLRHDMNPANNGNVFHGLPVTGFAATKFVNGFVPLPGGGYALANYTAAYHHRATINCTNNGLCS
jgi:hypothetical protein